MHIVEEHCRHQLQLGIVTLGLDPDLIYPRNKGTTYDLGSQRKRCRTQFSSTPGTITNL